MAQNHQCTPAYMHSSLQVRYATNDKFIVDETLSGDVDSAADGVDDDENNPSIGNCVCHSRSATRALSFVINIMYRPTLQFPPS